MTAFMLISSNISHLVDEAINKTSTGKMRDSTKPHTLNFFLTNEHNFEEFYVTRL